MIQTSEARNIVPQIIDLTGGDSDSDNEEQKSNLGQSTGPATQQHLSTATDFTHRYRAFDAGSAANQGPCAYKPSSPGLLRPAQQPQVNGQPSSVNEITSLLAAPKRLSLSKDDGESSFSQGLQASVPQDQKSTQKPHASNEGTDWSRCKLPTKLGLSHASGAETGLPPPNTQALSIPLKRTADGELKSASVEPQTPTDNGFITGASELNNEPHFAKRRAEGRKTFADLLTAASVDTSDENVKQAPDACAQLGSEFSATQNGPAPVEDTVGACQSNLVPNGSKADVAQANRGTTPDSVFDARSEEDEPEINPHWKGHFGRPANGTTEQVSEDPNGSRQNCPAPSITAKTSTEVKGKDPTRPLQTAQTGTHPAHTPSIIARTVARATKAAKIQRRDLFANQSPTERSANQRASTAFPRLLPKEAGPNNRTSLVHSMTLGNSAFSSRRNEFEGGYLSRNNAEYITISDDEPEGAMDLSIPPRAADVKVTMPKSELAEKSKWASRPPPGKGEPFTKKEKRKIVELRLFYNVTFREIAEWFPGRSQGVIATTWNKQLERNLGEWLTFDEQKKYMPKVRDALHSRGISIYNERGEERLARPGPQTRLQEIHDERYGPGSGHKGRPPKIFISEQKGYPSNPVQTKEPPAPYALQRPATSTTLFGSTCQNNETTMPMPSNARIRPRMYDAGEVQPVHPPPNAHAQSQRPTRNVARPSDYYARLRLTRTESETTAFLPSEPESDVLHSIRQEHSMKRPSAARRRKFKRTSVETPRPRPRPYLSLQERQALRKGLPGAEWDEGLLSAWEGVPLHIPFDEHEIEAVRLGVAKALTWHIDPSKDILQEMRIVFKSLKEHLLNKVSFWIQQSGSVPYRTRDDVDSFLSDLQEEARKNCKPIDDNYRKQTLGKATKSSPTRISSTLIRNRELGINPRRNQSGLRTSLFDSIGPSLSFTGTSSDVMSVAWSPDGSTFGAGSACLVDNDSMQYNRPYNLLTGNVENRELKELAAHYMQRPRTDKGVNSTHEMYASQDPRLFVTVSQVGFSLDGRLMFSTGYDGKLRTWDASSGIIGTGIINTIDHGAPIDLLDAHCGSGGDVIATGCSLAGDRAVRIISCNENRAEITASFASDVSAKRPEARVLPSALRWGTTPLVQSFLLAGFAGNSKDDGSDTLGEICVWDVNRATPFIKVWPFSRNVFDVAWSPHSTQFAIATTAGSQVNKGTRSVVRLYSPSVNMQKEELFSGLGMELECRAADVNDLVFSPYDPFLISVGCTNGGIYIWDIRKPHQVLLGLKHGKPVQPLQYENENERELLDTGVRFCAWGHDRNRLYSGSSDGVVTAWDPYRSIEDSKVRDVVKLDSGVMCGAWSPDYSRLLVGSVSGSVEVLEVGHANRNSRKTNNFHLLTASETEIPQLAQGTDPDSGIKAARNLVDSGAIALQPLGSLPIRQAVKGPAYNDTPYFDMAPDAATLREQAEAFQQSMTASECKAKGCAQASKGSRITAEEAGDSGRSRDRIPGVLRGSMPLPEGKLVRGMAKCSKCGRAARPRLSEDKTDPRVNEYIEKDIALCERCAFTCFRCGSKATITSDRAHAVECPGCDGVWSIGILGYDLLERPSRSLPRNEIKDKRRWKKITTWAKKLNEVDDEQAEYLESVHLLFGEDSAAARF